MNKKDGPIGHPSCPLLHLFCRRPRFQNVDAPLNTVLNGFYTRCVDELCCSMWCFLNGLQSTSFSDFICCGSLSNSKEEQSQNKGTLFNRYQTVSFVKFSLPGWKNIIDRRFCQNGSCLWHQKTIAMSWKSERLLLTKTWHNVKIDLIESKIPAL